MEGYLFLKFYFSYEGEGEMYMPKVLAMRRGDKGKKKVLVNEVWNVR